MYDKKIPERIRKGVKIDAPFPECMVLAKEVMQKECGYSPEIDYVDCRKQCNDQITTVRYITTIPLEDEKTGKCYNSKRFEILYPDRYVIAKETPKGVIRSKEDI